MRNDYNILLAPPDIGELEKSAVLNCLENNWISTTGPYSEILANKLRKLLGCNYAVPTNSGTSALELALIGVGVKRGDYVAVPSWTFSADPNAILSLGAIPVFIEIDEKLGLDAHNLEHAINRQRAMGTPIKAILAVHPPNGICKLDSLKNIAKNFGLPIVEDAAGSLFSSIHGAHLGGLTEVGCLSFNGNKIITGGSGGLLLTNDELIYKKCKLYAANSVTAAYRSQVAGSNRLMSNVCASIAMAQFSRKDELLQKKKQIFAKYDRELPPNSFFEFSVEYGEGFESNNWMYYLRLKNGVNGQEVVKFFESHKIQVRTFWRSLPDEQAYLDYPCFGKTNAQRIAQQFLCIPCGTSLTSDEQNSVIELVKNFGSKYVPEK